MREMSREQLESVYYAWCRAQAAREAFDQLYEKASGESYHDVISLPSAKFLFVWIGLLFSVVEFLDKFGQIPLPIAEEVRTLWEPWRKCRNAVVHIKNHPLAQEYDGLVKIPKSIQRLACINDATGAHICRQLGFEFPPFVGTPAEFVVPCLLPDKPT